MDLHFQFHQVDPSDALKAHATEKFLPLIEKFAVKPISCEVTFETSGAGSRVHCSYRGGQHVEIDVEETGDDHYELVDLLANRFQRLIRKAKEKLKEHHNPDFVHHNENARQKA